jgi:ATP synthase A chain
VWKLGIELLLGDVGLAQMRTSPQPPYNGRSARGWELLCFSPRCPETVHGATVALTVLELLVAFLQAYVFAILTCIYLNDALHAGH